LGRIQRFIDINALKPQMYGFYHIIFLCLMFSVILLLCILLKKIDDKKFRKILLGFSILFILMEIYKQLTMSYDVRNNSWSYGFDYFPLAFCSTIIYVLPFCALLKKSKFRDCLDYFIATYSLMGGLMVMFYPNTVFNTENIGILIQTMVHHALMVIIGVLFYVKGYIIVNIRNIFKPTYIFLFFLTLAQVLNVIFHYSFNINTNFYLLSPYVTPLIPLLPIIKENAGYIPTLIVYIIAFFILSIIPLFTYKIVLSFNKAKSKTLWQR